MQRMIGAISVAWCVVSIVFNGVEAKEWDGITPWFTGSSCNCNGFSNRCFFDQELYDRTGHGGHCLDCAGHRDGPNCERCRENFYQRYDGVCIRCDCSETGSRSLQCNTEGRCQCKPGITGDKCDRCEVNHYDFGNHGCRPCGCNVAGSLGNELNCDPVSGLCQCKENVEGQRCEQCKPGFFQLHADNEFGCTPCFCYGHSSVCRAAPGYGQFIIESIFARGTEKWTAEEYTGRSIPMQYNALVQNIGVNAPGRDAVYFVAPDRFLGDKRGSYNQDLIFTLRIGENGPRATVEDVIVEGARSVVSQPIFGQGNPLPTIQNQVYKFRLHENADFGWSPRLTARDFITVLSNVTAIKIRGTYTPRGIGFLDDVKLESTRRGAPGPQANNIEMCTCPEGYIGQFCESCAPGYTHEPPRGGPFARCVNCSCNRHADICDPDAGQCICKDNTAGVNCERCARGFYGNALQGTSSDCKPCPCPTQGACIELADDTVVCLECPAGYAGPRCELCGDGYFGDPSGSFGPAQSCIPCDCNENVDPNAVGNCNRTTGDCLKCIHNTGGTQCDQCLSGFFGNALAVPKGDCKACQCYYPGTVVHDSGIPSCDQISGQCQCKPYVTGLNCDRCENGFYDITSGEGCTACNCDPVGSTNRTCDIQSGQCFCREGIVGKQCEQCAVNNFGFSQNGCKPCDCDPIGSLSLQCDAFGQCPCRENVEGLHCDRCKENKYNRQAGCVDCPACYNLVQDAVGAHRGKLADLNKLLDDIANAPTVIDDLDFGNKLAEVQDRVETLWRQAKTAAGGASDKSLVERLDEMRKRLQEVDKVSGELRANLSKCEDETAQGEVDVSAAEEAIERARESIRNSVNYLETEGADALQKAMERSEKFGQQSDKMSQIARESRQIADELQKEAEDVEGVAKEALNTSMKAYDLAKEAINQQRNISDEIRRLQDDVGDTEEAMKEVMQLAEAAQTEASAALNDSLSIYQEAYALTIPPVDTLNIKHEAQRIEEESQQLKEDAEKLLSDHSDLLDTIVDQTQEAEDLLKKGIQQQQIADELLADVHAALGKAEDAVADGNKTLEEAQLTYATLQGFGQQVEESRGKALEALKGVRGIEKLIEEAENRTNKAVRGLEEAERDAMDARDVAKEAQGLAEDASQAGQDIKEESAATKEKASSLSDEAKDLMAIVGDLGQNLAEQEAKVEGDEETVHEALTKANEAKVKAGDAAKKVQEALEAVNEIMDQLNNTKDVSTEELDALAARLEAAEAEFKAEDLERRLSDLQSVRTLQKQWLRNYEEDLDKLRQEVDNIENIRNALPEGCWKRLKLEP